MGMSTLVHQISDTYDMVQGLKLTKKTAQNKPSYPSRNQSSSRLTSDSSVNANKATEQENESTKQDGPDTSETDEYGWIIDDQDPRFVHCPACGKEGIADNLSDFSSVCITVRSKEIADGGIIPSASGLSFLGTDHVVRIACKYVCSLKSAHKTSIKSDEIKLSLGL